MTVTAPPLPSSPATELRLVSRPAIPVEPPYDDPDRPGPLPRHPGEVTLALDWTPARPLRLVPAYAGPPVPGEEPDFEPVRTPRSQLPPPGPRAATLVRALLEAFAGDRPAGQLMRWTTPELFARVERLVRRPQHSARPWAGTLRRVHVCEPAPGIAEIAAVVDDGRRTSAMALRLEGVDGRWLMTELQLG